MSQSLENKSISLEEILEILRSQVDAMPPSSTSVRYLRALQSLKSSVMVGTHGACVREQSRECAAGLSQGETDRVALKTQDSRLKTSLTDWLVSQWLMQAPFTSASLYLDIISALYGSAVKAGRLPKTELFSTLKAQLKALGPDGWKSGIDDEIFQRALRLTKNARRLLSDDAIAADLIILSLNSSLTPLESLALLKREDCVANGKAVCNRLAQSGKPSEVCAAGLSSVQGACSSSQDLRLKTEDSQLLSLIFNNLSLSNARRRYVFPLRQSQSTPAQLKKRVANIVNALFKRARLPQATDPNQTVEALWAYAALRAGIPASEVVAYLGHAPLGLPILKLSAVSGQPSESMVGTHGPCVRPQSPSVSPASEDLRLKTEDFPAESALNSSPFTLNSYEEDFAQVGKIFLDNPPRWYAMSLRPGVRFTQVCRRIDLLTIKSEESRVKGQDLRLKTEDSRQNTQNLRLKTEDLRLFYPCEEIARAIGKKIVIKQRPFIHSVVFFKAKLTDIGPLFAKIGDLAWCYRRSAAPGAPYAEISESQFRLFQQTIASFTPDYEVASSGELELKPNDRVEILGGLFAGHEATFDSEVGTHGSCVRGSSKESEAGLSQGETIYRLNIIGDNGIEWRVSVDSRLAKQKN